MLNIYLTSFHMILLMVTQKADVLIFALAALFCLSDCGFGLERGEEVLHCFSWEVVWNGGGMGGPEEEFLIHEGGAGDGEAAAGRGGREDAGRW